MTMNRGACGPLCGMGARLAEDDSWAIVNCAPNWSRPTCGDYTLRNAGWIEHPVRVGRGLPAFPLASSMRQYIARDVKTLSPTQLLAALPSTYCSIPPDCVVALRPLDSG